MTEHKIFFRRSFVIILTAIMMFVLSACSTEESRKTEEYVSSVKTLVNEAVNSTRTLKTQRESFDCNDSQLSKAYISTLDTLADLYEQLIKLEAPDDYNDSDQSVKLYAEQALSDVIEMKGLVQYAFQNSDDSLYKKGIESLTDSYQECYNQLVSLSSEVQTNFRNS